jgi:hypothetical protein
MYRTKIMRAAAGALLLVAATASAQDWSSCASDLDDLRRRADDASSAAQDTDSKQRKFKSAEDELRQCLQFPQIYDFLKDGCQSKRSDYDSARSSYRSQLASLQSAIEDVDYKIRSSNSSCGVELTRVQGPAPAMPAGVQRPEQCAVYLRYKGRLPYSSLLETCTKNMPADQCRKCLGEAAN